MGRVEIPVALVPEILVVSELLMVSELRGHATRRALIKITPWRKGERQAMFRTIRLDLGAAQPVKLPEGL